MSEKIELQPMKLWHSPASPFVRKVMVTAHETGLIDHFELLDAKASPIDRDKRIENPLGKIPCLVLEDGHTLMDSRVICEYLDNLHDGERLIPQGGQERYNVLTTVAIADGILDAAVSMVYEVRWRPEEKQWSGWLDGQREKIISALDTLETWLPAKIDRIHMGTIGIGCALGYLDFRHPNLDWRSGRPVLTQVEATLSKRDSFAQTRPE